MAGHPTDKKIASGSTGSSRREFVQKIAYVAPLVTTLHAAPSIAGSGSFHKPKGSKGSSGGSHGSSGGSY